MPLNVLFAVAEMAPLVKVGGVGDVAGSLPRALRGLGLDVRVALPYYAAIRRQEVAAARVAGLPEGALWQTEAGGVPVELVEHEPSFGRDEVYGYDDDTTRFLSFCDGLLAAAGALDWRPDVIHLHDWHAGFLATRRLGETGHPWADAPVVFTIHNLGYRGAFSAAFARKHRFPPEALVLPVEGPPGLDRNLPYSALAQGILHAELVSTVSPTYAREVQTPELGGAFAPLLRSASGGGDWLAGVLNGIDAELCDPSTDPHLAARFDAQRLDERIENKRALQRALGLPIEDETPLIGMVSRLFVQKGSDLAAGAVARLLPAQPFQFVVLGQGEERYERPLVQLAKRYPDRVAARIAFDVPLGQLIYGGCDLFLMPSRYEPCGLGQLIAMRYGAVPVVRRTGGLADSVQPYGPEGGTGFLFDEATPEAVAAALTEALGVYKDGPAWRRLQERALAQDFSWQRSARAYSELYRRALHARAGGSEPAQARR